MRADRLTLITLGVRNLSAARGFYEALGFHGDDRNPSVTFYDMPGFRLGLFGLDPLAAEQGRPAAELGTGAITLAVNWPDRAAVDDAYAAAVEAGAHVIRRPAPTDWGGYSGYWADPDGHVWEYAHNPFWNLDAGGWLIPG
jgi:catechol 2,3-dioxygenase-like lactoylglutathione lyase family enzyme